MDDSDLNTKISQMGDKDQIIIAWLREMKDRATASGEYLYLQYLDMAIRRTNEAGEYSENFETADDYLKRLGDVFWQQIENEQKGTAFQNAAMTFMWGKYTNWGQGYPKNIPEPEFKRVQLEGTGKVSGDLNWDKVVGKKGETRIDHVNKHSVPNPQRATHGVFNGNPQEVVNSAWRNKGNIVPIDDGMGGKIYNIPCKNAGYESGSINTGAQMNYVTVVVVDGTDDIIAAFPSFGNYTK